MRINENILNKFLEIPKDILSLTNAHITEVESFAKLSNINNLVIGKILEINPHENADKLSVTKVLLGDVTEQIVCGASNIEVGQYVIVAKEGAVLPGDFIIKPTKIRGIPSNGMICSLDELGFDKTVIPEEFKNGIYYFNEEKEIGSNALKHLAMDGFIMELDLTPNRSDLLSHYGFAMDLSAVINKEVVLPKFELKEITEKNPLTIKIESKNTNSYYARYIKDVKIAPSPLWLQQTLMSLGCNPVNNVVDITNYLLYTYGIPMHAFDSKEFKTNEIVIKDNKEKMQIETLDETKLTLSSDEILITNGSKPLALGGIMGLLNSMITNETKDVVLEVASFDAKTIQKISKQTNLTSDSQLRFSRGINEELMEHVMNHAAYLIQELAQGKVLKGISKVINKKVENIVINVPFKKVNDLLGTNFTNDEIKGYLKRLNYQINPKDESLDVKAPTYRNDILILADVVEEIGRIYGLDKITNQPVKTNTLGFLTTYQQRIRNLRHLLTNSGFSEVVTYSLLKENEVNIFNTIGSNVSVLKPISNDRKTLRQSLLNGTLEVVNYNKNRGSDNIFIFEIGNVFSKDIETKHLAILLTGETNQLLWDKKITPVDFYYASGLLNKLFNHLNLEYTLKPSNNESFHPYQQAEIIVNKKVVGIIGKIHPLINKHNTFAIELNIENLPSNKLIKYEQISKYPNVERDLAIVLTEDIKALDVINLIKQTARKILVDVSIFDVYKGVHIEKGHQSMAVRMIFNDKEKTLESTDVDKVLVKITTRIERELGGKIRS